jgi:hypothetical protein
LASSMHCSSEMIDLRLNILRNILGATAADVCILRQEIDILWQGMEGRG